MTGAPARRALGAAGLSLALATIAGAVGAHALTRLSASMLHVYDVAVRYQFYQSLGLLGIGLALRERPSAPVGWSAVLVGVGLVLFSGSLYALALGAPRAIGFVTPLGGVALIAGWLAFAYGLWRA